MLPIEMVQMTNQSYFLQSGRHHGWVPAYVPGAWCADSALPSAGLWLELAATPTHQCTLALGQGEEHS